MRYFFQISLSFLIFFSLNFSILKEASKACPVQATALPSYIKIDLNQHVLDYYEQGQRLFSCKASGGANATPSPNGRWRISELIPGSSLFNWGYISFETPWKHYKIKKINTSWTLGLINSTNGDIEISKHDLNELFRIVDKDTEIRIIHDAPFRELSMNDKGTDVYKLQKLLHKQSYYYGPINGIYDFATRQAVMKFQKNNTLCASGVVNINTYKTIVFRNKLLK